MGLYALTLDFVAVKNKSERLKSAVEAIKDIVPVINKDHEYLVSRDHYSIEFKMTTSRNLSIRTALCASDNVIDEIWNIAKALREILMGGLIEHQTGLTLRVDEEKSLMILKEIFRDQKELFLDHIANIDNSNLRSDAVKAYAKDHGIQPRNPSMEVNLMERKKKLLERIKLI